MYMTDGFHLSGKGALFADELSAAVDTCMIA